MNHDEGYGGLASMTAPPGTRHYGERDAVSDNPKDLNDALEVAHLNVYSDPVWDELRDEITRLRAELADGSFYKESDIDAMQDEITRLRAALHLIVDKYDARSELFISADECAGTLADTARAALAQRGDMRGET